MWRAPSPVIAGSRLGFTFNAAVVLRGLASPFHRRQLARAAGVAGMNYSQLIERIVAFALARSSAYEYQEASAVGQG